MLVFDISSNRHKLPALTNWINPRFRGEEDKLTPSENVTLPKNWKDDFPDYVYEFPELLEIKKTLNEAKKKIDPITENSEDRKKFDILSNITRAYDELRGKRGILVREYGAEIVTNAWLKMSELMIFVHALLIKRQNSKQSKVFNSFHIAEAPGNFMLAINHKIKTDYPSVEWSWLANSFRNLYEPVETHNVHYLEDNYGLIANHINNWLFGADGDGDITSTANLVSFKQEVEMKFGGKLHLITSDVKYVPVEVNFDEEENINLPVNLGHLICSLMTLSKGGVAILKQFTFFEAPSVCMLYLMTTCFKIVKIVKPETSKAANSEIYVVGIDYRKNLSELHITRLLNIMKYIQFLNTEAGSPSIFPKKDIPETFAAKLKSIAEKLAQTQIVHIDKNVSLFYKYSNQSIQVALNDFQELRKKAAEEWIKNNDVKKMDSRHHLVSVDRNQDRNRHGRYRHNHNG